MHLCICTGDKPSLTPLGILTRDETIREKTFCDDDNKHSIHGELLLEF